MEYEISDQPQESYRPERTAIDGVSPERREAPEPDDQQMQ